MFHARAQEGLDALQQRGGQRHTEVQALLAEARAAHAKCLDADKARCVARVRCVARASGWF
jgi:hypothetical protein